MDLKRRHIGVLVVLCTLLVAALVGALGAPAAAAKAEQIVEHVGG